MLAHSSKAVDVTQAMLCALMTQKTSPARLWAINALEAIFEQGASMDNLADDSRAFAAMSPRDRALARAIAGTALRRNGQIDALLARFMQNPLPDKAGRARAILRCAMAEILYLRSPAFAVVNDAVNLAARQPQSRPFKKLVNALLRKAAREEEAIRDAIPVTQNIPGWLRHGWREAWGEEAVCKAAQMLLQPPATDLTVFAGAAPYKEILGGRLLGPQTLRLDAEMRPKGAVPDWPGFADGAWQVQDAAAAMPAQILAPKPGEHVADLCAAPGGKSAQLLGAGAHVTCVERSATRLRRLRENMRRLGFAPELVCADARYWQSAEPLDAVLLDAPCSATGVFRRHPDVLVNKTPKQVQSMAARQFALLRAATRLLRPGGRLVYCVCSAQPEEGEAITARALASLPLEAQAIDPARLAYGREFINGNAVRIPPGAWAQNGGLDAFYMAAFIRS